MVIRDVVQMSEMKRILLTTYDYPFGCGEAFLESEMPVLSRSFERIYIVPVRRLWIRTQKADSRPLPSNVEVLLPYRYGAQLWLGAVFKCFQIAKSYRAIAKRVNFGRSGSGLKALLSVFVRRLRWAFVDTAVTDLQHRCDAQVGYAYWKSGCAYPVARLRERGRIQRSVARAHHHDLYPALSPEGYNPFDGFLKEWLDDVYSISHDGMEVLAEIGYREDQIRLSRLGVQQPKVRSKRSVDGILRLISVSRVERIKRLDLLIEALKLVPDTLRIQWTHFGTGSQFSAIQGLLSELPEHVEVDFKGEVRNEEVLAHYVNQPVDMLINVSESEGVPVSIMEALSYGVPCVATDVGATSEIVNANHGVLLSANPTAEEVASAVLKLREAIDVRGDELSGNAIQMWNENFHRENNFIDFASQVSWQA